MELDEYSLHYERFITHLKFFVQRVFSGTEINDDEKSFILMLKDELIYLTIHIRRVTTKS